MLDYDIPLTGMLIENLWRRVSYSYFESIIFYLLRFYIIRYFVLSLKADCASEIIQLQRYFR
jgi:hypothetical protein